MQWGEWCRKDRGEDECTYGVSFRFMISIWLNVLLKRRFKVFLWMSLQVAKLVVQYLAATTSKEANLKGGGSKVIYDL